LNERPSNKAIPTFETSILDLFNSSTQSAEASTTSSQQQASNGAFYRCYLPRLTGSLDHLLACENHHQTHPFLPRRKSLPALKVRMRGMSTCPANQLQVPCPESFFPLHLCLQCTLFVSQAHW
jgi:hypothetical protein